MSITLTKRQEVVNSGVELPMVYDIKVSDTAFCIVGKISGLTQSELNELYELLEKYVIV